MLLLLLEMVVVTFFLFGPLNPPFQEKKADTFQRVFQERETVAAQGEMKKKRKII